MYVFPNTTAGWTWAHQHSNRADCSFLAYVGRSNRVRQVTYIDDEDALGDSGRIITAELYDAAQSSTEVESDREQATRRAGDWETVFGPTV